MTDGGPGITRPFYIRPSDVRAQPGISGRLLWAKADIVGQRGLQLSDNGLNGFWLNNAAGEKPVCDRPNSIAQHPELSFEDALEQRQVVNLRRVHRNRPDVDIDISEILCRHVGERRHLR